MRELSAKTFNVILSIFLVGTLLFTVTVQEPPPCTDSSYFWINAKGSEGD